MRYIDFVDDMQGHTADGAAFGYAGIAGRGGRFFTWRPTLAETLASIEDDVTDPPKDWPQRAYAEVRGYVRRRWAAGLSRSYGQCLTQ